MKIHDYFVKLNRINEKYRTDIKTLEKHYEGITLKQKLEYLLKKIINTNNIFINHHHDGYISGYIISDSFKKESEKMRMKRIWSHLNNFLFEEEIKKIIHLTTYSEEEWKEEFDNTI